MIQNLRNQVCLPEAASVSVVPICSESIRELSDTLFEGLQGPATQDDGLLGRAAV
jgi:hypothetical protein